MVSTTDDLVGGEAPPSRRGTERRARQPGRLRRALVTVAEATAVGALFVLTAAGSAVAHLGLPAPRRLVVEQLNANLAGLFKGRLLVDRIGYLKLWRGQVGDVRVRVLDPSGQQVLLADGVTARLDLGALLASLRGGKSLSLTLHGAEVNVVDLVLREEPDGTLTIARAFESATPPEPPKPGAGPGPTVRVDGFHLRHAWVHGGLAAYPFIDADALDAHGDFRLDDDNTDVTLREVGVDARALPLTGAVREAKARLEGHLHLPTKGDLGADAVVHELQAGQVKATARGSIAGSKLDAAVDLPPTAPEALREVVPEAPLYAPVGAKVTAKGELPRLDVVVRSTVGAGTVDVDGTLGLGDVMTVDANVVTRNVSIRSFSPEAPEGAVTATAKGAVRVGPGDPEGTFTVTAEPTVIAGQPTPAVQTEGSFAGASVKGVLHAQEPGLVARVTYDLKTPPGSQAQVLALDLDARSDQLASNARLGGAVSGQARVTGRGTVTLGERTTVVGEASVQGSGLRAGAARVGAVTARARVAGDVSNPQVNVQAAASRIVAGDYPLDRVTVRADGTPSALRVEADGETPNGSLAARAHVQLGRGVALQGTVQGDVGRVDVDVKQNGATTAIQAHARGVDLTRAARLARLDGPAISGTVDADVDVTMRGDDLQGTVKVEAREAGVDLVQGVGATLNAAIKGREVQAEAKVAWVDGATLELHTRQARLAGPSLRPASWQKATFDAGVNVDADLARTMELLPEPAQPLRHAEGRVKLTVDAVRSDLTRLPDVRIATHTESVDVTLPPGSDQYGNIVGVAQRISGADVEASLGLDGATEKLSTAVALRDTHGPLVSVEASVAAPLRRIAARPWEAIKLLETSPIDARIALPERKIQDLPQIARPTGVAGSIAFSAEAHGTAQKPAIAVSADVTRLTMPGQEVVKEPIDIRLRAGYQGDRATADVTMAERKVDVATIHGEVNVAAAELLAPPPEGPRWDASARADFMGLPVQSLAALAGSSIVGCLYGTVRLDGLHKDARVAADLRMEKMQIGDVPLNEARVAAGFDGQKATVQLYLREDQGYLDVAGSTGMTWGAALTPSITSEDGTEPMDARMQAKAFRLKPLEPFLQTVVAKLDGQLDADIHIKPSTHIQDSRADGWLTLTDGVAEPIALGQELRNIEARVTITPSGQVSFQNITFRGLSGRATLSGEAQLEQLRLASVKADLTIRESERFVLTTQGVALGDIYGHVRLDGGQEKMGAPLKLQVNIDEFEIDLPNTGTRSLQSLDPDPTIRIGYRTAEGRFQRIETTEERKEREERRKDRVEQARRDALASGAPPSAATGAATAAARAGNEMGVQTEPPPKLTPDQRQAQRRQRRPVRQQPLREMPLILDVNLSNKTKVRRGSQISIDLHGKLLVGVGDRVAIDGQAQVDRGYVDIQGRRFFVERAIATFDENEDMANPTISATARYEAGDATRVYADFLGTVEAGKLTLRSDPALSQGEILSLILFGSREGLSNQRSGQGSQNRTAQAAGVGGGVVTQGLNEALSGLNLEEVSTRVDTSQSGNPRPELSVAITRDVTASISYRLGIPTPGQNPDTTMLKLDYRFKPRWSLETSFGDRGTSILDLFWRYRY